MSSGPKILIVDNEERFRKTMRKLLSVRGLEAATAGGGREALEELRRRDYDVVILDVHMPDMGGVEVLSEIKKIDASTEVIILTGYASTDTAVRIIKLGGYDFLLKPYDLDDLIEKIEAAYDRKTARRKLMGNAPKDVPREP